MTLYCGFINSLIRLYLSVTSYANDVQTTCARNINNLTMWNFYCGLATCLVFVCWVLRHCYLYQNCFIIISNTIISMKLRCFASTVSLYYYTAFFPLCVCMCVCTVSSPWQLFSTGEEHLFIEFYKKIKGENNDLTF